MFNLKNIIGLNIKFNGCRRQRSLTFRRMWCSNPARLELSSGSIFLFAFTACLVSQELVHKCSAAALTRRLPHNHNFSSYAIFFSKLQPYSLDKFLKSLNHIQNMVLSSCNLASSRFKRHWFSSTMFHLSQNSHFNTALSTSFRFPSQLYSPHILIPPVLRATHSDCSC